MIHYVYSGAAQWSGAGEDGAVGGLFRQVVGESDWQSLSNGLPDKVEVRAIAIHPQDPQVIYLGTQDGPYRTTDSGEHWQRLDFPERGAVVWTIIFHPQNPDIMYLGTAPAVVYRSDNGGESWRRLAVLETQGGVHMGFPMRVIRMTTDPSNPDEVYAGLEVGGVMRSSDAGETWHDCTPALLDLVERDHLKSQIGSDTNTEGMMDTHALEVSPARPGTVFLATRMGMFCSPDRGDSWQEMEIWRASPFSYARDIQVAPHDPNTLYAALSPAALSKSGAIYRSQDLGQTWQRFDHDVAPRRTMMAIAPSRRDAGCVYGVNSTGQVFGTQDDGETWAEYPLPAGVKNVYALACG